MTADSIFSGITTFARLPWVQCLTRERDVPFDIAFIGAPFVSLHFCVAEIILLTTGSQDTGTSYRPGARFGPGKLTVRVKYFRIMG